MATLHQPEGDAHCKLLIQQVLCKVDCCGPVESATPTANSSISLCDGVTVAPAPRLVSDVDLLLAYWAIVELWERIVEYLEGQQYASGCSRDNFEILAVSKRAIELAAQDCPRPWVVAFSEFYGAPPQKLIPFFEAREAAWRDGRVDDLYALLHGQELPSRMVSVEMSEQPQIIRQPVVEVVKHAGEKIPSLVPPVSVPASLEDSGEWERAGDVGPESRKTLGAGDAAGVGKDQYPARLPVPFPASEVREEAA